MRVFDTIDNPQIKSIHEFVKTFLCTPIEVVHFECLNIFGIFQFFHRTFLYTFFLYSLLFLFILDMIFI